MDRIPLVTSSTLISLEKFWTSVLVYHDRPHLVNRKLATISPVLFCEISLICPRITHLSEIFTREALLYEIRQLDSISKITPLFIRNVVETYDKKATIEETNWRTFMKSINGKFVSIRVLYPRRCDTKCLEVVIFDKEKQTATFFAVQECDNIIVAPRFPYHIELSQNSNLRIILNTFEDAETSSAEWLADKLFPKLLKWCNFEENSVFPSLSLIAPDQYSTLYLNLKSKYGEDLVKNWSLKAKTDPQKYVFEDIAIATYLICLWNKLGCKNVNFVDCGCGNGLLVYILNSEGFKGCGYDIRKREVWNLYGNNADLKIGTVTPKSQFSEASWIIGNHSDELTPWIPIIALNSSPKTNYFVLPCCSFDLNGQKYVRINTALSQYRDYMDYVRNLSIMCGFTTSEDKLRIPSTKRICLVGVQNLNETEIGSKKKEVSSFIHEKASLEFIPRESVEKVRNCTQLNKELKERIINLIVSELLDIPSSKNWNEGSTQTIADLSLKISPEDKQHLKKECGGLQTLLKNHRYIFDVKNGSVTLRKPPLFRDCNKYKDKPCWFEKNHPDGCLHQSETCAYKHTLDQ